MPRQWYNCCSLMLLTSVVAALPHYPAAAAPAPNDTWSDGLFAYTMSPPVEGYFVPRTVFKKGYQVPVKEVLAAAKPMTKEELQQYTTAGTLKTTDAFPLFVFPNHKVNVFLWKGKRDGPQQKILPRVWNGELWASKGYGPDPVDAVEHVFYHPADQERCYVLVCQQTGTVGQDRINTDRVWFGRFPPTEAIVKQGVKTADAVVYLPSRRDRAAEMLDCLKGDVTGTTLRAVPGIERVGGDALVFLKRDGKQWSLRFFYSQANVTLHGEHGELRLSIPRLRDVLAKNEWLNEYQRPPSMRWHLARQAADAKDAVCSLRLVNPGARRDEWLIVELVAGKEKPGGLYQQPITRSQRDGGNPLFRFVVTHGGKEQELTTKGRFGRDSLAAAEPEKSDSLKCQYRFLDCGPGVVKLALKPTAYPWQAKIEGRYVEIERPFDPGERKTHATPAVTVEVK